MRTRGKAAAMSFTGAIGQMTTQQKIMDSLVTLLEKFPYNSVSVQSICDAADISRKTFGRYFQSKEDVVIAQINEDFAEPIRKLLSVMSFKDVENSTQLLYKRNYEAFYARRGYYLKVVDALGIMWLVQQHMDATLRLGNMPYTADKIGAENALGENPEADFVQHFYAGVGALGLKWWIEHDFCISADELAALVAKWGYARLDG